MKIDDLEGGSTWVVGLSFCFPPRYVRYDASRGLWQWTERLVRATGFPTRELAQEHIDRVMGDDAGGYMAGRNDAPAGEAPEGRAEGGGVRKGVVGEPSKPSPPW